MNVLRLKYLELINLWMQMIWFYILLITFMSYIHKIIFFFVVSILLKGLQELALCKWYNSNSTSICNWFLVWELFLLYFEKILSRRWFCCFLPQMPCFWVMFSVFLSVDIFQIFYRILKFKIFFQLQKFEDIDICRSLMEGINL